MRSVVVLPTEAVAVKEVVSSWLRRLSRIIRQEIRKEWFITVAAEVFLHWCPQTVSKKVYLCRSVYTLGGPT